MTNLSSHINLSANLITAENISSTTETHIDYLSVTKVHSSDNIVIDINNSIWDFGTDGNLTLPSNSSSINYANGTPYGGASPPSPTFIYNDGALTKITYPTGEYKQLTYNNGVLSQMDYYDLTNTKRKVFNYIDNVLASITESTL